ncbi:Xaa-Pro peptidase family protein [Fulvivirgaceae bacterium BMA10]|uniref:Xaa-Pro peptidase family protein n=1 Tax=Splendidivirga corallicola TaxID=3051826 RepID=A0ABT8KXF6_9BACT|nr:Xaa-Pro peptidase family protein [Fulvivirgaceae bacterium BMA10]
MQLPQDKPQKKDIPVIEEEDFEDRHNAARRVMAANGIDLLILSGSVNLYYFSGIEVPAKDRLFAMFLPKEGDPFFICPGFEKASVLEKIKYGSGNIRTWEEYEDPFALSASILRSRNLGNKTIGIDEGMPFWYFSRFKKSLPYANFTDANQITNKLRSIKSGKEIALIRRASEISLQVHKIAFSSLFEGMTEHDINRIYHEAHEKLGASNVWGGASFGPASSFVHGTQQTFVLREGMVILADSGGAVDHYTSDISRTITFGSPPEKVRAAWEVARKAQLAGIEAIRPGVTCESVDLAIRKVIEDSGWLPSYKYLRHRAGHGIGLEVHEPPYLVEGNKTPLEENMVVSFDGAIYFEGEFGIRLEDNIRVTEDGCEIFGDQLATSIETPLG